MHCIMHCVVHYVMHRADAKVRRGMYNTLHTTYTTCAPPTHRLHTYLRPLAQVRGVWEAIN